MKKIAVLSLASGFGCCALAFASDGALDASFGADGIARAGIADGDGAPSGCRPIVLADGRILICGTRLSNGATGADFLVARFNVDGTLDPTFGISGVTTIDFDQGTGGDHAEGIALQADGRIIVGGTTHGPGMQSDDFAVARLSADGVIDRSFATAGKATIAFDLVDGVGNDDMSALVVESNGTIVVAGSAETSDGSVVAVARLLNDGTRDANFNASGKVTFGFAVGGSESDHAAAAAVDAQDRIVIAATATTSEPQEINKFAVARLLENGSLDPGFAGVGYTTIAFDPGTGISDARALGLAIMSDGGLMISGYANSSPWATPNMDMAAARLGSDGSLDSTFGTGGTLMIPFDLEENGMDAAVDVREQADGRLLLVGTALGGGEQYGVVARVLHDGTYDASFGTQGKASYDLGLTAPGTQAFTGVAMQGTQILVGGVAFVAPLGIPQPLDCVLVRLTNDSADSIFAGTFD